VSPVAPVTKNVRRLMRGYLLKILDVDRHLKYRRVQLDVKRHQQLSGASAVEEMRNDEKVENRSSEDTGADRDGRRG
jgi:hypothetical protein